MGTMELGQEGQGKGAWDKGIYEYTEKVIQYPSCVF